MNDEKLAELHLALVWDCDACGRENFVRTAAINPTEAPADVQAAMRERLGLEEWEEFPEGALQHTPASVTCQHCGQVYTTGVEDE